MAFNNQMMYGYNPALMNQQNRLMQLEQQYQQYQQPQQMYQQSIGLSGRVIDDISTVNANEVPMNGELAFFPKRDMSEIYVRNWNADGSIKTTRFKPILDENQSNTNTLSNDTEKMKFDAFNEFTDVFQKRIDEIEMKIDAISKNFTPKSTTSRAKKDGE